MSNAGVKARNSYIRVITLDDLATNLEMYLEIINRDQEEIILLVEKNDVPKFDLKSGQSFSADQPLGRKSI